MTSEIEVRSEAADVVPYTPMPSDLLQWVEEARQAKAIAISLAKTSFVPQSLKGSPENVVAAILAGHELGLRPMAALRSLDIIQGTPALRAHAMRGLVQARGHKVWLVEQAPEKVVMRGQRREADGGYGPEQEVVWTIRRAADMGLTGKAEWKKQPQTMLTARATGEICRLIASDVLHAMPYAAEELDGFRPAVRAVAVQADQPAAITAAEIMGQPEDVEVDAEPVEVEGEVLA